MDELQKAKEETRLDDRHLLPPNIVGRTGISLSITAYHVSHILRYHVRQHEGRTQNLGSRTAQLLPNSIMISLEYTKLPVYNFSIRIPSTGDVSKVILGILILQLG